MADSIYRFCPSCGAPLTSRRVKASDPERPVCSSCGHVVYLDPKVAVGTIINMGISTGGGEIVLVRRAIEPGYGLWVFPGGYVDRGEEIMAAARREALEESGLDVRIDRLVNIYSYEGSPIIVVYAATALSGTLCGDEECLEAGLFTADTIPWERLAFRSTTAALRDYFNTVGVDPKVK